MKWHRHCDNAKMIGLPIGCVVVTIAIVGIFVTSILEWGWIKKSSSCEKSASILISIAVVYTSWMTAVGTWNLLCSIPLWYAIAGAYIVSILLVYVLVVTQESPSFQSQG